MLGSQEFTCSGVSFQPTTFSFIEKETPVYILLFLRNFLETVLLWKASCELVLKEEFYEKWWTNIFIIIKRYPEVASSFKKIDIARESVYLRIICKKLILNLIVTFNSIIDFFFFKYVLKYFASLTIFRKKIGKGVK